LILISTVGDARSKSKAAGKGARPTQHYTATPQH
jgi:hypothetical protein